MSIVAASGLSKEARMARHVGLVPIIGAGNSQQLAQRLEAAKGVKAVISFGIAGSLAPLLRTGDAIIATHVVTEHEHYVCDAAWSRIMRTKLTHARSGVIAGSDIVVSHLGMKKALFRNTGAHAVDMESHVAARYAMRHNLPFVALRVISDGPDRTLPPAALEPLKSNGKVRFFAVMGSILSDPSQVAELIQTGREASQAFRSLLRCCNLLGSRLSCPYLR